MQGPLPLRSPPWLSPVCLPLPLLCACLTVTIGRPVSSAADSLTIGEVQVLRNGEAHVHHNAFQSPSSANMWQAGTRAYRRGYAACW